MSDTAIDEPEREIDADGPEAWRETRIPGLRYRVSNHCVERVDDGIPIPRLRYNRRVPHPGGQTLALCDERRDVFLGGGGGTGKSGVLLLAALQFCDVPAYSALFLRRTHADLVLPGAALDVAHEMLDGMPGVTWKGSTNTFLFDTGTDWPASLTFGHLSSANAHERYRGAEISACMIDEVSHVPEHQALFLFQRLRRPSASHALPQSKDGLTLADVPIRYRVAANPGGRYMQWVKGRYVDIESRNPQSVHYRLTRQDNPSLDFDEYALSLSYLPESEMRRMLYGDWDAITSGKFFDRSMFKPVADYPKGGRLVRYWDCAATEELGGNDPDWSVGVLATIAAEPETGNPVLYIIDVARHRWSAGQVEPGIQHYALTDPPGTECHWEQEPGSNSKILSAQRKTALLGKVQCKAWTMSGQGKKADRARLVVPAAEAGRVRLVVGDKGKPWVRDFIEELHAFDGKDEKGRHDDQVDGLSGVFNSLTKNTAFRVQTRTSDKLAAAEERDRRARLAADAAAALPPSSTFQNVEDALRLQDDPSEPRRNVGQPGRRRVPQV